MVQSINEINLLFNLTGLFDYPRHLISWITCVVSVLDNDRVQLKVAIFNVLVLVPGSTPLQNMSNLRSYNMAILGVSVTFMSVWRRHVCFSDVSYWTILWRSYTDCYFTKIIEAGAFIKLLSISIGRPLKPLILLYSVLFVFCNTLLFIVLVSFICKNSIIIIILIIRHNETVRLYTTLFKV